MQFACSGRCNAYVCCVAATEYNLVSPFFGLLSSLKSTVDWENFLLIDIYKGKQFKHIVNIVFYVGLFIKLILTKRRYLLPV